MTPGKHHRGRGGFSLVEVILALGVVTVALIGILALLPVAIDTALDSRLETQATVVAQTIMADLRTGGAESARVVSGTNPVTDLAGTGPRDNFTVHLRLVESAEHGHTSGWHLVPAGVITSAAFANGVDGAFFLARVTGSPGTNGLALVEVVLEHPGRLPASARQSHRFVTLMGGDL
jgi:type II secretory pathway pseudopilin PulG